MALRVRKTNRLPAVGRAIALYNIIRERIRFGGAADGKRTARGCGLRRWGGGERKGRRTADTPRRGDRRKSFSGVHF